MDCICTRRRTVSDVHVPFFSAATRSSCSTMVPSGSKLFTCWEPSRSTPCAALREVILPNSCFPVKWSTHLTTSSVWSLGTCCFEEKLTLPRPIHHNPTGTGSEILSGSHPVFHFFHKWNGAQMVIISNRQIVPLI